MKPASIIPSGMLAIACALSACGGGGGGDPVSDAVNSAAQDAAGRAGTPAAGPATNPATGPAPNAPESAQPAAGQPGAGAADAASTNAAATDTNASLPGVRPAGNYWEFNNMFFRNADGGSQYRMEGLPTLAETRYVPEGPANAPSLSVAFHKAGYLGMSFMASTVYNNRATDIHNAPYQGSIIRVMFRGDTPGVYTVVPSQRAVSESGPNDKVISVVVRFGETQPDSGPSEYVAQSGKVRVSLAPDGRFHLTSEGGLPAKREWDHPAGGGVPGGPAEGRLFLHDFRATYLNPGPVSDR